MSQEPFLCLNFETHRLLFKWFRNVATSKIFKFFTYQIDSWYLVGEIQMLAKLLKWIKELSLYILKSY